MNIAGRRILTIVLPLLGIVCAASLAAASTVAAPSQFAGSLAALHWRSVGPTIGGRVVAVAGVPGQDLYYLGGVDGGI
jgi:hypothetical protein